MCAAQRAVADARANTDELGWDVGVADVVFDLLHRATCQKARWRHAEWILARRGEPGRDSYEILLGDADFNDLMGQSFRKGTKFTGPARITRDYKDLPV